MSLAPKIDEIAVSLTTNEIDIAFFSETWLKDSIPDDFINIKVISYSGATENINHMKGSVCI